MDWKQKLSSRKLWAAIVGVAMGVAMVFGLDENTISTVAGAVTSLSSIIIYIMTEGKVDAAAVSQAYVDAEKIIGAFAEGIKDCKNEVEADDTTAAEGTN